MKINKKMVSNLTFELNSINYKMSLAKYDMI